MTIRVLIVDDEPLARAGLRQLLAEDPAVSTVAEAANGREALGMIRAAPPDIVFLDVQMPEHDGFAVVRELAGDPAPVFVFVTAHDQYAVRAFEINALDYLLKPVTRDRFARTLARAKERLGRAPADAARQMEGLLDTVSGPIRHVSRFAIRVNGRVSFVTVSDIDWIQSAENYVELHCGASNHLLHATMATMETALNPATFVRVHRSIIVNIARIASIEAVAHGEYHLVLKSGAALKSGRTYAERVRSLAANPF